MKTSTFDNIESVNEEEESEILDDYDACWIDGDSAYNDCHKCPHRFDCNEWEEDC